MSAIIQYFELYTHQTHLHQKLTLFLGLLVFDFFFFLIGKGQIYQWPVKQAKRLGGGGGGGSPGPRFEDQGYTKY